MGRGERQFKAVGTTTVNRQTDNRQTEMPGRRARRRGDHGIFFPDQLVMGDSWKVSLDTESMANCFGVRHQDVITNLKDGRAASKWMESMIKHQMGLDGHETDSDSYDVRDKNDKWEVRTLTDNGVHFCPNNMKGKGRSFSEQGFLDKLNEVEGYIICNVRQIPQIKFTVLSNVSVLDAYERGDLNKSAQISGAKGDRVISRMRQESKQFS